MFKAISWGQFTGVLFLGLILYYAYVGLTYYRAELLGLAKGRGKAADDAPAPVRPLSSLIGRGPLIAKPALTPPATPPEVPAPTVPTTKSSEEVGEGLDEELEANEEEEDLMVDEEDQELGDLPALDLPTADGSGNFIDGNSIESISFDAKAINFTQQNGTNSFQDTEIGVEPALEEYDPSQTIGVAQLGNYFERAAEGQLTQDDIVEQAPVLQNTNLLMAFYQASNKSAQRTTAHLYAGIEEPALD
ncbi:hypothetical protein [Hymenobacter nivis]|uniref:Uncharacterized protein n=1 Tax=Hymenobacter nivis TaxID=1850093 RepID=A0A502GJ02_9BACT|nr:hypothetical protein [Hymenobacter nivis]TPG60936.1 hypothetical protein EAH73_20435 [Hymenobacter nivis]